MSDVTLTEGEIDRLVWAAGPDADHEGLMDVMQAIIAEREKVLRAQLAADIEARESASVPSATQYRVGFGVAKKIAARIVRGDQ